jgi:hypothetical protein
MVKNKADFSLKDLLVCYLKQFIIHQGKNEALDCNLSKYI